MQNLGRGKGSSDGLGMETHIGVHGESPVAGTGDKSPEVGDILQIVQQLECGPMPNVMAALPTTGGALCSTPQFG